MNEAKEIIEIWIIANSMDISYKEKKDLIKQIESNFISKKEVEDKFKLFVESFMNNLMIDFRSIVLDLEEKSFCLDTDQRGLEKNNESKSNI